MMKKLEIKNFKSIDNLTLDLSKVNVLIGEPNTGKSNLLETLGLFSSFRYRRNAIDHNPVSTDFVRYSSITNLFRDNNPKNTIEIKMDDISLECEQIEEFVDFQIINKTIFDESYPEETVLYFEIGRDGYFKKTNENEIDHHDYIPKILFYRFKALKEFSGTDFAYLLPPHGINLISVLLSNPNLQELFINILEPYGLKLNIRTDENKIEIAKDEKGMLVSYPLSLMADTFYYLFMYLTAIKTSQDAFLILEEPETHLFPFYSKILSESIALDNYNNQFFISTHNPYFLTSLIEKTPKKDLRVFIVHYENYKTKVHCMTEKQMEEVLDWDNIFFNFEKYLE